MKTILSIFYGAAICFTAPRAVTAVAQVDTGTGKFRGSYLGLVVPAGNVCSGERWLMSLDVDEDGNAVGTVVNFAGDFRSAFNARVPFTGKFAGLTGTNSPLAECFPFCNEPGAGWTLKGSLNAKTGTGKGTIDGRSKGACLYTFTLWRRYRLPVD